MVTAFKKVDGVTDAIADCHAGTAKVTFNPKKTNAKDLAANALKGTKFTASLPDKKG